MFYFCPRSPMLYVIHRRNAELTYQGVRTASFIWRPMAEFARGNLFEADVQGLANTVNTLLVHAWNDRKRESFAMEHIQVAWNRLRDEGWL